MTDPTADHDAPRARHGMAAGQVLIALLVCVVAWSFLYAPELKRAAETHPEGTRRDLSLTILSPLDWIARTTRLATVTDAAGSLAGRDPDAALGAGGDVIVDDLPTIAPDPGGKPEKPPVRDTELRKPTNDKKLRVVVVGDSLAVGLGYFADRVFRPAVVDVRKQARISTGLARPDYFDWPAQMQLIVDRYRPDLTIVMVGENDNQPL
ncbi:MAG: hypothetical protein WD225_15260, partial [Ilumatobacteraceae bacterium]